MERSVFIGWDPREEVAWKIAKSSLLRHITTSIPIHSLRLRDLIDRGLYRRPTFRSPDGGRLIDAKSARTGYDGSISTEHAIARFFVPLLARTGWALFVDGDVLFRADISEVFNGLDETKAVYCVKHEHAPSGHVKMDGQVQSRYRRKNWSSFVIFNCCHPSNMALTFDLLNTVPGRDLHAFCWLGDDEIGEIAPGWNFIEGVSSSEAVKMVHFTEGVPNMPGYENVSYTDEWRAERERVGV